MVEVTALALLSQCESFNPAERNSPWATASPRVSTDSWDSFADLSSSPKRTVNSSVSPARYFTPLHSRPNRLLGEGIREVEEAELGLHLKITQCSDHRGLNNTTVAEVVEANPPIWGSHQRPLSTSTSSSYDGVRLGGDWCESPSGVLENGLCTRNPPPFKQTKEDAEFVSRRSEELLRLKAIEQVANTPRCVSVVAFELRYTKLHKTTFFKHCSFLHKQPNPTTKDSGRRHLRHQPSGQRTLRTAIWPDCWHSRNQQKTIWACTARP